MNRLALNNAQNGFGEFCQVATITDRKGALHKLSSAREEPINVAIVDDDDMARWFLQRTLEQSSEFACIGSYASGVEALREIPKVCPRIVLMDVRMPSMSGIQCTRRLKALLPEMVVILVSGQVDLETMSAGRQAGADRYLTKPFSIEQCLATLRFAIGGVGSGTSDSPEVGVRSTRGSHERACLTDREEKVMRCFAKGLLYKETAAELGISYSAVHKYQHNIFKKFHVANRTEAIIAFANSKPG